ncbi:hypothetical protein [Flavobacterium lacustre]|uniref:hypothetical protein n=1 Tax=Flavobacterium lacustre TaxID=3016339 RepID=UPI0022B71E6D|nr:hypothetical protein [Flavobacterium lacustre]
MKTQTGIWIDSSKAIIVTLNGGKEKITEIDSEIENNVYHNKEGNKGTFSGAHQSDSETKFKNRKNEQTDYFIEAVLSNVKKADELYVFGPAETKTKLEQKIQHQNIINPSILRAVETSDKMTLNEIVAQVKDFYKS